jgi:hypothetical protein
MYFDNSKKSFAEKCDGAIKYYTAKYGHAPTAIWCNPNTAISEIPGIVIVQSRSILPNNFWVGQDTEKLQSEE